MAAERIDGKAFAEGLRTRVGGWASDFEAAAGRKAGLAVVLVGDCLLYTSPSPRDRQKSRMPSSA